MAEYENLTKEAYDKFIELKDEVQRLYDKNPIVKDWCDKYENGKAKLAVGFILIEIGKKEGYFSKNEVDKRVAKLKMSRDICIGPSELEEHLNDINVLYVDMFCAALKETY